MQPQSPFLDLKSFVAEEAPADQSLLEAPRTTGSPFLSVYESEEGGGWVDPQAEDYAQFLNELHDEEFDEALFELASEATALYDGRLVHEQGDPRAAEAEAERFLQLRFAPLLAEAEAMIGAAATEFGRRDPGGLTDNEIETIVDRYQPSADLSPAFENFWGAIKQAVKKVARKGVALAKKGISVAATLGLGPVLNKLKALIKPLLKRVLQFAIGKLPTQLQPIARKLAERLPFLKEAGEDEAPESGSAATRDFAGIQHEFNAQAASLLFAPSEVEQDLELAQIQSESSGAGGYSLADLDRAREQFVEDLGRLKEGEDPTPHVENFLPAILPALKLGLKLVGRKRVVSFLAKFLAKLIQRFVGPQYAPALSQAMVDVGLRLIHLETTPEDESRAAGSAVAATVEETVRRVAALPDYVLDDQPLLEAFALEAFEHAAAANLPPVLPEETYRKRPDLREAKSVRGAWMMLPLRGHRKKFKKFSRILRTRLTPQKAAAVETVDGAPLSQFLEEQLGLEPGEEVEANVHLYETTPGTLASDVARLDETTPGLGSTTAYPLLHPLTPQAAGVLLGEPGLGREAEPGQLASPYATDAGQRLYYLEIPGKRPLTTPGPGGQSQMRRRTRVGLKLDFPANQILVRLYLSEKRAQELAVKLRQQAHLGAVLAHLRGVLERGLRSALTRGLGRLKIVHEAVTPGNFLGALRRLPALVPQALLARLLEWTIKGLADYLKQQSPPFIAATEDAADGVTLLIAIANPPGFASLRQALKGKLLSWASLKMSDGSPTVKISVTAGYAAK